VKLQARPQPKGPGEPICGHLFSFNHLPLNLQLGIHAIQRVPDKESGIARNICSAPDRVEIGQIGVWHKSQRTRRSALRDRRHRNHAPCRKCAGAGSCPEECSAVDNCFPTNRSNHDFPLRLLERLATRGNETCAGRVAVVSMYFEMLSRRPPRRAVGRTSARHIGSSPLMLTRFFLITKRPACPHLAPTRTERPAQAIGPLGVADLPRNNTPCATISSRGNGRSRGSLESRLRSPLGSLRLPDLG
jgi:hypothetical protein